LIAKYGSALAGLEQYAVKKFAEAMEVFPRTLAENAGLDATDILAKLYVAHEKGDTRAGVDIERGDIGDVTAQGIRDLLLSKLEAYKLALNVVVTVLKVDQIIMSKPAGGPRMNQREGHWDDED